MLSTQVEKGGNVEVGLEHVGLGMGILGALAGFATWILKLLFKSELNTLKDAVENMKQFSAHTQETLTEHGERLAALEAVQGKRR